MRFREIRDRVYTFFYGIRNIWTYKKVIWNDRWYDYGYLIDIIDFKLKDMINNWHRSHYIGSDFTKGRMEVLRRRIASLDKKLDDLAYDFYVHKKYTEEEYKKNKEQMIHDTWMVFGKNYCRFWD